MPAKIKQVSFAQALSGKKKRSSIRLSTAVGLDCLNKAELRVDQLDALLNAGIYRDKHIGEPAIAALIHGDIQKKSKQTKSKSDPEKFFCFDISNGGNGPLNAIEIASGLIDSGKLKNALIVTGDALPRRKDWLNYPFGSHASAILLEQSNSSGFKKFFTRSYPEFIEDYSAELQWTPRKIGKKHHHQLQIERSDKYLNNCLQCAKITLLEFLESCGKNLEEFDMMITSHSPIGFTQGLKKEFNLPENILVEPRYKSDSNKSRLY